MDSTLTVQGLRVFVRERGDGFPLVLLNGIGANCDMWGPTAAVLSRRSRTIAFDCPGTGRSDTPIFPLAMASLSHVLLDALDALGHTWFDVLGFSFGGLLAQQVAKDGADRVRRLALVSSACGLGSTPPAASALAAVATPMRYYSREWFDRTNPLLGELEAMDEIAVSAYARARFEHPPTAVGYTYQLWAACWWSSLAWLSTITIPTLIISGGRDRLVRPENAYQLARLLPRSRLLLLPDASHFPLLEEGPATEALSDFFSLDKVPI
jgi:pimeloyl-ACP methyl ester carboxylesterase